MSIKNLFYKQLDPLCINSSGYSPMKFLLLLLVLSSTVSAQTMYRCVNPDGTQLSFRPSCPTGQVATKIPPPVQRMAPSNTESMREARTSPYSETSREQSVPPAVDQTIRQIYAQKYPNDYSMQKVLIDDQRASYLFLQQYNSAQGVPQEVFNEIRQKYATKYPADFSMQKVLIQDQVRSYLQMHR